MDVLFGWLTKPEVFWTPIDELFCFIETILAFIIFCVILFVFFIIQDTIKEKRKHKKEENK